LDLESKLNKANEDNINLSGRLNKKVTDYSDLQNSLKAQVNYTAKVESDLKHKEEEYTTVRDELTKKIEYAKDLETELRSKGARIESLISDAEIAKLKFSAAEIDYKARIRDLDMKLNKKSSDYESLLKGLMDLGSKATEPGQEDGKNKQ